MQKVFRVLDDPNRATMMDQLTRHDAKPLLEMFAQNAGLQMGSMLPSLKKWNVLALEKEGELVCWFGKSIVAL